MTTPNKNTDNAKEVRSVEQVRQQIVDAVLVVAALIGFLTYIMSLMTSVQLGWQAEQIGFGLLLTWIVGVAALRNRVPYVIKTGTVIIVLYGVGILNFIGWGLISSGAMWFILMVLLTTVLHSSRKGLIAFAVVVLTFAFISAFVHLDLLVFTLDFNAYARSDVAWLSRLVTIAMVSAMMVASLGQIINVLREQLIQYRQHSNELAERTSALTIEMKRREEAEETLAHVIDDLQDLDRLKDNFIDGVSHELRTPIANIQLYHQLLAMKPEKKDEYLATLKLETERLSYIVEQMIHASGDSYDMALTTMVDIDLKAMVVSLFMQETQNIDKHNILLSLPDTDKEYAILASPEHIERALGNLVDNAVKYTPADGQITVQMLCDESHDLSMVGVAIINTGDCLSDNERNTIFERFVRGETSLKMGVPGAGLGLSIAQQIAQKYGGHINVACDEAQANLTFTLWLPSILPIAEFLADDTATPISSI